MRFHLLKILTILSIVIYPCYAYSQNSVKGSIKDNYNNSITGAAIAMQSLNDTLFVRGCISDNNGKFQIDDLPSGDYRLSVSCLGFTSYAADISLKQTTTLDDIVLKEKAEKLDEVVVKGNSRIEKAEKSILIPTALEKKHSVNGFDLLSVMQIPELDVSSDRVKKNINDTNQILGYFYCQGKMPIGIRSRYEQLIKEHPEDRICTFAKRQVCRESGPD